MVYRGGLKCGRARDKMPILPSAPDEVPSTRHSHIVDETQRRARARIGELIIECRARLSTRGNRRRGRGRTPVGKDFARHARRPERETENRSDRRSGATSVARSRDDTLKRSKRRSTFGDVRKCRYPTTRNDADTGGRTQNGPGNWIPSHHHHVGRSVAIRRLIRGEELGIGTTSRPRPALIERVAGPFGPPTTSVFNIQAACSA